MTGFMKGLLKLNVKMLLRQIIYEDTRIDEYGREWYLKSSANNVEW